ncbi:MAG TPA: hypothetical protein VFL83_07710 [Anaeromyxobacter sp.]|nr:hypothetical protein [Anaeromyxobacter sp.]
MADRPEAEQAHAVLSRDDESPALLRREVPLAGRAYVGRHEPKRLLATEGRQNALAVVANDQRGPAAQAPPFHRHVAGARIDRVLHELGDGLARVRLRAGEPADEIERVGGAEEEGARGGLLHQYILT